MGKDYKFPVTLLPCERCKENYMEYLCHELYNNQLTDRIHFLCSLCIVNGITSIINTNTAKLRFYDLPVLFTQQWDEEEGQLVPTTRKGGLFSL